MDKENIMNNLNSILVEGKLKEQAVVKIVDKYVEARFTVVSRRYYREIPSDQKPDEEEELDEKSENVKLEKNYVPVLVEGGLAERCGKLGIKGKGVRVVGRLQYPENGTAIIVAEHVEFTPETK